MNNTKTQRNYRLLASLASSATPANGSWLDWFHTNPDQTLGQNLIKILQKIRKRQQNCFLTPAPYKRIKKLRNLMQKEGIDAFIVGHDDDLLSEYVTLGGQRLCWLTGFCGSAGILLLSHVEAVLFVDGRYTIQASMQVDLRHIRVCSLTDNNIRKEIANLHWLSSQQISRLTIGIDYRLFSIAAIRKFRKQLPSDNCILRFVDQNPIDQIWINQPSSPISPVTTVDPLLCGKSIVEKLQPIFLLIKHRRAQCLLLHVLEDIAWLLNIRAEDIDTAPLCLSRLIIYVEGKVEWFVSNDRYDYLRLLHLPKEIYLRLIEDYDDVLKTLGNINTLVWIDPTQTSAAIFDILVDSGAQIIEASNPVSFYASHLNENEIASMKRIHLVDGIALINFISEISNNIFPVQESELASKLLNYRKLQVGFLQESFRTIIAARQNSAICHYYPNPNNDIQIKCGDIILVDSGGHYNGGTTDVTRVIIYGQSNTSLTQEFRRHYTLVLRSLIMVITAKFPIGSTGAVLDTLARTHLWQQGLDYDHSTGHGVGANLTVHYGQQRLSRNSSSILEAGMVVSLEPGVYFKGRYGIRLENLALIVHDINNFLCFENLTWVPFAKCMIDTTMMNINELQWLNEYNRQLYRRMAPLLDQNTAKWLAYQTEMIT